MWYFVTPELEDVKQEILAYQRVYTELVKLGACSNKLVALCPGDARIQMKHELNVYNDMASGVPVPDELFVSVVCDDNYVDYFVNDE
jgi:hypothetical protein